MNIRVRFGKFWVLMGNRPEESVKEDVETLRASPFFKGMQILGFVQDTETGLLNEVVGVE
jgi:carbonic anhydrase